MARVIDSSVQSSNISNYFPLVRIVMVGMILGFLFWGMNSLIGRFTNSSTMSSDIASILTATIGLIAMVTMRLPRPIIIVLSVGATLWGLATLTSGLSLWETIIWEVALYTLAYLLFSWISRCTKVVPVLILIIAVVVIARITTTL